MDPLSQAIVGSVAAQQVSRRKHIFTATVLGALAGMTPDLDVLIHSDADPLLALEYHRQFTHSLIFIPVGSFICALFAYLVIFKWWRILSFQRVWLYCALGYATHGLLDACTTYGTLLLWPFSYMRVAWNTISIIDPLFTLPLTLFVILAIITKRKSWSLIALGWIVFYSGFGIIQRERAEAVGWRLAEARGHQPVSLEAKPSFANLLVWKVVYATSSHYFVDAVRVGIGSTIFEGDSIQKLDMRRDFPWLDSQSQQGKDVERFRWFSNGYVAASPSDPNTIIDMRYSMIPNEIKGMWGITLNPEASPQDHIVYTVNRNRDQNTFRQLWAMIVNDNPE